MNEKVLELKNELQIINELIESGQNDSDSISKIEKKLNDFNEKLTDLEVDPILNSQHGYFKHHFYSTKSQFKKKISLDEVGYKKFLNLSQRYSMFKDESNLKLEEHGIDDFTILGIEIEDDFTFVFDYKSILTNIQTEGLKEFAKSMCPILENFLKNCSHKMTNPNDVLNNFKSLDEDKKRILEFLNFCYDELEKAAEMIKDNKQEFEMELKIIEEDKNKISDLEKEFIECYNLNLKNFFSYIFNFNDKELDFIFFKSNSKTINQNYREYSFLFHTDKSSLFVSEENLDNFNSLFSKITNIRNKNNELKNSQENLDRLIYEANSFYELSQDYYNYAFKNEKNFIRITSQEIEAFPIEEVENLFKENFEHSIEKFKVANFVADSIKNYQEMLNLRIRIADCLFKFNHDNIDLKLAVLRPIYLIEKHTDIFNNEKFSQLKKDAMSLKEQVDSIVKIFVNQKNKIPVDQSLGTLSEIDDAHITSTAISLANISITALSVGNLLIRAYPLMVEGALTLSVASGFIMPFAGIAVGIAFWFTTKNYNQQLSRQSLDFRKEQKIRDTMNKIIIESVEFYQKHDFENFLKKLSEPIDENKTLIKVDFESKIFDVSSSNLMELMHIHGFRPDSIAYLLYIISDTLMYILFDSSIIKKFVSKFKIDDSDLKTAIDNLLKSICDELNTNKINLEKEAEELDKKARSLHARVIIEDSFWGRNIKNNYYRTKEFFFSKGIINDQVLKEFDQTSFKNRLNQIRNLTKFSRLIYSIVFKKKEMAKEYVKEYKDLINDEKFLIENRYISDFRYFLVKDFIEILDDSSLNESKNFESNQITNQENIHLENKKSEMNDLNKLIDEGLKSELKAKEIQFFPIKSIEHLFSMKNKFKDARNHKKYQDRQIEIDLGFMRSLLKLSKFNQVKKFMQSQVSNQSLIQNYEFWLLGAQAFRKSNNYKKAKELNDQSKTFDSKNLDVRNESKIIENLTETDTAKYLENLKTKTIIRFENDYYTRIHTNEVKYNILSLDGGGIRGIVPLVWLSEIESRTHRPISHLFNMIAGTSTGSIIASALSIPEKKNTGCLKPFYTANRVLDIYLTKGKNIFLKEDKLFLTFGIEGLFNSKYSNKSLSNFLNNFQIANYNLKESLTDLVIPAVEYQTKYPMIFSSFEARNDEMKNFKLYDAVMSSTAAPTFFDRHIINDIGEYEDGGLAMNDPSDIALEEVLNHHKKLHGDTFLLSLGTSTNLIEPDQGYGKYHFLKNFKNYLFNTQDATTELKVISKIGSKYSNYQKWQLFTENEIYLDDCREKNLTNLVEYARQYIEELYVSDCNYFNKLLERLESGNEILF